MGRFESEPSCPSWKYSEGKNILWYLYADVGLLFLPVSSTPPLLFHRAESKHFCNKPLVSQSLHVLSQGEVANKNADGRRPGD